MELVYKSERSIDDVLVVQRRARIEHAATESLRENPRELDDALVEADAIALRKCISFATSSARATDRPGPRRRADDGARRTHASMVARAEESARGARRRSRSGSMPSTLHALPGLGEPPIPPLEMRELVGPTDPALFDNPSGTPVYPYLQTHVYEAVLRLRVRMWQSREAADPATDPAQTDMSGSTFTAA